MESKTEFITKEVPECFMVVARHFGMPGGIFDDGEGTIEGFFDTIEEADEVAKTLFVNTQKGLVDPRVWVLRIEKSYARAKEGLVQIVEQKG